MWDFLGSLFASLFGFGSNIFTNMFNKKYQDEANKTNLEIARQTNEANMNMTAATNLANRHLVREQNAAAAEEAEKAYQRSKPTTQVGNMQAAGMSLAGAINSLNGGGSYSPAPVNVASDEASRNHSAQVSPAQLMSSEGVFANIANAFMQREQIKSSERMQRESMQKQAEMQREQIASAERIAQLQADTTNRNADNRLDWEKKQFDVLSPYQIRHIEAQIDKINADVDLTNVQKEDLQYKYAEYVSNRSIRDAVSLLQELESVYKYHVTENDFNDFKRSYMYYDDDTDSYQYITHTKALTKVEAYASNFWDVIAKIIPANKIGKIISIALGK